ncbi:hypothetical protein C8A01DRAFT_38923 [Parachaetomium inaequale]|uniref:Uncharacterized protein n=1 Tax=Parachaetomium inaequale TaxID=2588326 RepID=A0AAN6PA69_9PEZI|nr:hypothetical protein C8A01DRAFT_38923 [Parachaetomium inaequale]
MRIRFALNNICDDELIKLDNIYDNELKLDNICDDKLIRLDNICGKLILMRKILLCSPDPASSSASAGDLIGSVLLRKALSPCIWVRGSARGTQPAVKISSRLCLKFILAPPESPESPESPAPPQSHPPPPEHPYNIRQSLPCSPPRPTAVGAVRIQTHTGAIAAPADDGYRSPTQALMMAGSRGSPGAVDTRKEIKCNHTGSDQPCETCIRNGKDYPEAMLVPPKPSEQRPLLRRLLPRSLETVPCSAKGTRSCRWPEFLMHLGFMTLRKIKQQQQQQNPHPAMTIVSKLPPYDPVEVEQHQLQPWNQAPGVSDQLAYAPG